MQKFQLLQILRGLAAILVVTTHASLVSQRDFGSDFMSISTFTRGGIIGVETFFILSGFIHFYVHSKYFSIKTKLKPFILKRLARVYPIYWIISLPLIPIFFIAPSLGNKGEEGGVGYIFRSLLLIPQEPNPLLSVGWTLTFELFFYILVASLIYFRPKVSRTIIALVLLGTLVKFFADIPGGWINKYQTGNSVFDLTFATSFIFSRYNLHFLAGGLGGLIVLTTTFQLLMRKRLIACLGSVMLGLSTVFLLMPHEVWNNEMTGRTNRIFYYIPVVIVWIISSTIVERNFLTNVPRPLTFIGDASYSIFLLHYPVLLALAKFCQVVGFDQIMGYQVLMYLITASSIGISIIFYAIVEKPLTQILMFRVKQHI